MKRFLYPILIVFLLAGCAPAATPTPVLVPVLPTAVVPTAIPPTAAPTIRTLNVFAASSLTNAFTDIGQSFEELNPDVQVSFNFAASSTLLAQIKAGGPADVFASASKTEMDSLAYLTLIKSDAPRMFLSNKLVVLLPTDNPAGLTTLEDLADPGVRLVLAAEEVPAGKYARQALDQMDARFGDDFKSRVLANVVSNEENVQQAVAKVQLGEADAGIVYASDAIPGSGLRTIEIPAELNVVANYPIAALTKSANADLAAAFIDYVLSSEGQASLKKWGFAPAR